MVAMNIMRNLLIELERAGVRLYLDGDTLKSKAVEGAVTPEIAAQIRQNKTDIIRFLAALHPQQASQIQLLPRTDPNVWPSSFAQQRLYALDKLQGGSVEYHMPQVFTLDGEPDLCLLEQAFRTIVQRHEVLRTVFADGGDGSRMRLLAAEDFQLNRQVCTVEQRDRQLEQELRRPFELERDFLLRVSYLQVDDSARLLILVLHHVASDGWSMQLLLQEFISVYQSLKLGIQPQLTPLPLQYADYASWQRQRLQGDVLQQLLDFWQQQLADLPLVHSLPLLGDRTASRTGEGAFVSTELDGRISQRLQTLAHQSGMTPFMLCHAALALVLSAHSNSHDIVVGTPVANRRQQAVESLLGFFTNTLVLRLNTGQATVAAYLAHVRQTHLAAHEHQELPFEKLVEALKVPRNSSYSPLFQIMLTTSSEYGAMQTDQEISPAEGQQVLADLQIRPLAPSTMLTKFELELNVTLSPQGVLIDWAYDPSVFAAERISMMATHLTNVLQAFCADDFDVQQNPLRLPMLAMDELQQLLSWNDTARAFDSERCIHHWFEAQVALTPTAVAVECEGQSLSYAQLNARANQLAHYLKTVHGVGVDVLVGLCMERSLEMVIGLWAILKAGGAYVPLDPAYPAQRLAYLREDASVQVVLSQLSVMAQLGLSDAVVVSQQAWGFADWPVHNVDG